MTEPTTQGPAPDLDALEAFLDSEQAPESAMDISTLDGFLAGIAVGPELITPSEWMPLIWGDEEPVYEGIEEAQRVLQAIMGRYNEILMTLRDDPEHYAPVFYEDTDGSTISECWAEGFVAAIRLRPQAWAPIFEDQESAALVTPIVLAGCTEELASGEVDLDLDEDARDRLIREAADYIPACVFAIDQFWRTRRMPAPPRRTKVGRNDACPCGSGKKYKRCCDGGPSLH